MWGVRVGGVVWCGDERGQPQPAAASLKIQPKRQPNGNPNKKSPDKGNPGKKPQQENPENRSNGKPQPGPTRINDQEHIMPP